MRARADPPLLAEPAVDIVAIIEMVERERDAYRAALQAALDLLHDLSAQNQRLRICLRRDLEERGLRV